MSTEPGLPRRRDEAPPQDDSPPGPERLLALSDEIVAIALTLLILDLKVPATSLLRHPRLGVQPDSAWSPGTAKGWPGGISRSCSPSR
jgi:hypothetical protein